MEVATELQELRQELGRLQEREAELSHLLQLERERRVRAEQDSEVEKQSCLELGHLLSKEKQLHQKYPSSPSQMTLVPLTQRVEAEEDESPARSVSPPPADIDSSKNSLDRILPASLESSVSQEENAMSLTPLPPLEFTFSSSVFSQLPNDLQRMLGVGNESKPLPCPSKLSLTKAAEAVKVGDPQELEQCIATLEEGTLQGADGQMLLELACEHGHTGCVRVLLNAGCSPSASSREDGMVPLHLAAKNGHLDSLQLLLEWSVSTNQQDDEGHTPLFLALCEGHQGCANRLLHAGSSLQAVTKLGYTTIHAAVSGNLPDALRILLVHLRTSLDKSEVTQVVNYTDKDGSTALHFAASRGYRGCVGVLCASPEVDLSLRDRWNRTALDISTEDCRELLQNKDYKLVMVMIEMTRTHDSNKLSSIAIGKITVLKHHKLSDVEPLVGETLRQFCNTLSDHRRIAYSSISEKSSALASQNKASSNSLSKLLRRELQRNGESYDYHVSILRNSHSKLAKMDLSRGSIASYRIGHFSWKAGELSPSMRSKNLYSMFGDMRGTLSRIGRGTKSLEVTITLKGAVEGCVDQLAFDLMLPVAKLKEYVEMVEENQTVMLYGPQGSGKTFLAKSLADFLKHKHDTERVQIIHASLHPGFKRDDLFRLLHLNSLLVHLEDQEGSTMRKESKGSRASTLQPKSHVVILDDIDRVSTPNILAELLTALEYRGPYYPVWVDTVYSRDGAILYPAGHYYLKEKCYFIATSTHASSEGLQPAVMDQFVHFSLGLVTEPSSGVLHRHLMSRLVHSMQGDMPHRSDLLYKVVQWVWEVRQLYNHLMLRLDLPELTSGLRHFLQCPVESSNPDVVCSWLCNVWNQHLVPSIKTFLLSPHHSGGSSTSPHQEDNRHDTINQLIMVITQKVFKPTCPLDPERTVGMLQKLHGSLEAMATGEEGKYQAIGGESPPLFTVSSCAIGSPPPRGSKLPSNSMVAYKDMATKSSPRMKGDTSRQTPVLRATKSLDQPDRVSLDEEVAVPQSSGKKKARRIRSFSLFSRDAMGSLPKFLRRGSTKTSFSLASVEEEGPKKRAQTTSSSQQLDDIFDILSTANSNRFNDQRSPAPSDFFPKYALCSSAPVPKYVIPTGSPKMQNRLDTPLIHTQHPKLISTSGSPPAYSMPDLTADEHPTSSQDVAAHSELDMQPRSHSVVNILDEECGSGRERVGEGGEGNVPITPAVWHIRDLPLQPSSEPTRRKIYTSPPNEEETQSATSTPGTTHKVTSPLTAFRHNRDPPLQPYSEPRRCKMHTSPLHEEETQLATSSPGTTHKVTSPLAAVKHIRDPPLQPSSEPTKRRIHTSPFHEGETQSATSTPGIAHKVTGSLTTTSTYTKTSPSAKSPKNISPHSAEIVYVKTSGEKTKIKARSVNDMLCGGSTVIGDFDLSRAASDGGIKPQTSDYVSDDGRTLQAGPNTRDLFDANISGLEENGFDMDLDDSNISGYSDRRASDASSVMSSTLFFSASLGFSPDSEIMKGTPPRDSPRFSNPRPSITMMEVLTDEELAEM